MRNTGKPSQEAFEKVFETLGKRAFLHRFRDKADLFGLNKRNVKVFAQPADYIVTNDGMHFAEVKSTADPTASRFNLISDDQWKAAAKTIAAGGEYIFYVHRPLINQWFKISAKEIAAVKANGKQSIPFSLLSGNQWPLTQGRP